MSIMTEIGTYHIDDNLKCATCLYAIPTDVDDIFTCDHLQADVDGDYLCAQYLDSDFPELKED